MSNDSKPKKYKSCSCIILAGGEGKRMGGVDKGLLEYKNKPLVEHVIDNVKPQVDDLVISANRNTERYQHYSTKVISDQSEQYLGPLAGIAAALPHCSHEWILIVPCDTPFLPNNLIDQFLCRQAECNQSNRNLYIAESNNKLQPVMLIHKTLLDSIRHSLHNGQRRLMHWVQSHQPEIIIFQDASAFRNFNNNDDLDT